MKSLLTSLLFTLSVAVSIGQTSGVPGLLGYQGHVTDANGDAIGDGSTPVNRTVFFKFYTESTGGAPIYAESQIVTISGGEFSVLIGNGSGIDGLPGPSTPASSIVSLPAIFNGPLYLGLTVDDGSPTTVDPEVSPRQQIVSSAYALRARIADSVAANGLTTATLQDGAVTTNKIGQNQVTTAKILNANVTTEKIADANVTAAKLDLKTIGLWIPTTNGTDVYRSAGNVGIGQSTPGFPLNFGDSDGDKISLSGASGAHYGLGIKAGISPQSSLLQIHTPGSTEDIGFGYGSSASFTEIMRIRGNGNVGLGTTTPTEKLHISGGSALVQSPTNPAFKLANSSSSATADLGIATTAGQFSSSAAAGDAVLRTNGKLHLLSGSGTPAVSIDTGNRVSISNLAITSNLGIGRTDVPNFPLTFADTDGDKISLSGNTGSSTPHFGIGLKSNVLRIHSSGDDGDVAFGYGSSANFTQTMRVKGNGLVVIGQPASSLGILNVGGITASYYAYGHLNTNGSTENNGNENGITLSIDATGHIRAEQFDVRSDARLKTILHPSDSAADLATLSRIEITDYHLKDTVSSSSSTQKKVIAQQVEQVFPQAVTQRPGVVPDVYQHAEAQAGWVQLATDLRPGERVRLIEPDSDAVYEVLDVRPGAFRTDLPAAVTDVFVYGREVPDVRSVDYDAIAMLNVSATQELHLQVTTLQSALAEKDARISALESRLQALEQLVTGRR